MAARPLIRWLAAPAALTLIILPAVLLLSGQPTGASELAGHRPTGLAPIPRRTTMRRSWHRTIRVSILVMLALTAVIVRPGPVPRAEAATFTVNSTGDAPDSNTADGICDDGSGNCTLRAAIEQANASAGTDTINFNIPGAATPSAPAVRCRPLPTR